MVAGWISTRNRISRSVRAPRVASAHAGYYVYIVECADGTYYTGWTTDVARRLGLHNSSRGAKYVRGRHPVELVYVEEHSSYRQALRAECSIKKLTRAQKRQLVRRDDGGSVRNV